MAVGRDLGEPDAGDGVSVEMRLAKQITAQLVSVEAVGIPLAKSESSKPLDGRNECVQAAMELSGRKRQTLNPSDYHSIAGGFMSFESDCIRALPFSTTARFYGGGLRRSPRNHLSHQKAGRCRACWTIYGSPTWARAS